LPEDLKVVLSKNVMRIVACFMVEVFYIAEVRTGVHVFAICVKTGISKMRNIGFSRMGTEH